jgi:DNA-binding Xre family transcriptional regulator
MTGPCLDLDVIATGRQVFRRTGLLVEQPASRSPRTHRVPPIRLLSFDRIHRVFMLVYDDHSRATVSVSELEGVGDREVLYWDLDEVRTGVEIVLDDGTVTSFSGDFARYLRDPEYRRWVDEQRDEGSSRRLATGIARRVRAIREERGMSLAELSRRCGIAAPNLHRLEAASHVPSTATLGRVAAGLDVPLDRLLVG